MNFYQTLRLKHNLFKPKTNRRAYEILNAYPCRQTSPALNWAFIEGAYLASYLNNIPA